MEQDEKNNSLEKMMGLLDVFTDSAPVWSSEELISYMGTSRSTAYRYIKTLHNAGLLAAVGNGSYVLGQRILELDRQLRLSDPLYRLAGPPMTDLVKETGHASLLCVLYSHSVMCIRAEGLELPEGFFSRGQKRPLFKGAASKVILAHLPPHQLQKLFNAHKKTIAAAKLGGDWAAFREQLKNIRQDGYCRTESEFTYGIVGIASPLFNKEGKILGSIGIGMNSNHLRREKLPHYVERVKKTAGEINTLMAEIDTLLDQPARGVG